MTRDSLEPGSVASGIVRPTEPAPEIRRLEVLIGRWLNEGHLLDASGEPADRIVTSDVYEWAPGGSFVLHPAYGRIGEVDVGGVEIIGFDRSTGSHWSHFFDSQGNASTSQLRLEPDRWIWQGENTRCTAEFSEDGRTQTAHHERRDVHGNWVPSMEVVLTKIG